MNDEIKTRLLEWIGNAGELISSEVPGFCHDLLTFGFYQGIARIIFYFVGLIVCLFVNKFMYNKTKEFYYSHDDKVIPFALGFVAVSVAMIALSVLSFNTVMSILKIHFAPKLYLIDYLRG